MPAFLLKAIMLLSNTCWVTGTYVLNQEASGTSITAALPMQPGLGLSYPPIHPRVDSIAHHCGAEQKVFWGGGVKTDSC